MPLLQKQDYILSWSNHGSQTDPEIASRKRGQAGEDSGHSNTEHQEIFFLTVSDTVSTSGVDVAALDVGPL